MSKVGTLAWARKTGGKLRPMDHVALAKQFVTVRLANERRRKGDVVTFDPADIRTPDTEVARRAAAVCERLSEPWLVNHAYRAYFWGAYLARASAVPYDEELLFASCILHDLGLTETCKPPRDDLHCFGVIGARRAVQEMADSGWDAPRLEAMEEAVVLHLNINVPISDGVEAHLLHEGTILDVVGARHDELSKGYLTEVLERFPRASLKEGILSCVHYEAATRPESRIAYLVNNGFEEMVQGSAFEE